MGSEKAPGRGANNTKVLVRQGTLGEYGLGAGGPTSMAAPTYLDSQSQLPPALHFRFTPPPFPGEAGLLPPAWPAPEPSCRQGLGRLESANQKRADPATPPSSGRQHLPWAEVLRSCNE